MRRLPAIALLFAATSLGADVGQLQKSFEKPPDDARIMMRWWWYGSSVTKPQLERELKLMKAGGIGGVEVQPTYPLVADDVKLGIKNLPFLSDEFLDALRFASGKAKELGLRFDLTLGSGCPLAARRCRSPRPPASCAATGFAPMARAAASWCPISAPARS